MNDPLEMCLAISHAHASLALKLDDELGTLHGLGYGDFLLLTMLARAEGGRMAVADLGRPLGLPLSAVTRQLVLLEKTGLAQRGEGGGADTRRQAMIRPAGRKLVESATVSARAVCAALAAGVPGLAAPALRAELDAVARAPALAL